jgi:hypothetical protein
MHGTMYVVKRTTVYLPEDLKMRLERRARSEGITEAEIIRSALAKELSEPGRPPTVPLFDRGWGDPTLAERVDEALAGFGDS